MIFVTFYLQDGAKLNRYVFEQHDSLYWPPIVDKTKFGTYYAEYLVILTCVFKSSCNKSINDMASVVYHCSG